MIFYFTATGNSLYVAKLLNSEIISIPQALKNKEFEFSSDTVGFVFPVYSGESPLIVSEFIQNVKIKSNYIYMILTYGNDDTVAVKKCKELAENNGIIVNYIATIKTVDNFLPVFDMEQQNKNRYEFDERINGILKDINNQKQFVPKTKLKGSILYNVVKKMHSTHTEQINGEAILIKDNCTGCGLCTKVCPRGIIDICDKCAVKQVKYCDFCLACVHICPEKAIGFSFGEKNPNARYRNENVSIDELIKSNNQL